MFFYNGLIKDTYAFMSSFIRPSSTLNTFEAVAYFDWFTIWVYAILFPCISCKLKYKDTSSQDIPLVNSAR